MALPNSSRASVNVVCRNALQGRIGFICLCAFAVIWIAELYGVQKKTLIAPQSGGPRFDLWAPRIRLILDVLCVSTICVTFKPRTLALLSILLTPLFLTLLTYENYFHRPLSMIVAMSTWREGMKFSQFFGEWIPVMPAVLLMTSLVVKLALLIPASNIKLAGRQRLRIAGAIALAYVLLFAFTIKVDPLNAILTTRGIGRLGLIRGYTGPWLAELYYLNDTRLLTNAIERVKTKMDRLTPVEAAIPIHQKLAIIQVESLDYNVLDLRWNGKEITPFLNELRRRSMFYRVLAYHVVGSADADFTMLAGGPPAMNVLNYNLAKFPYDNTLPQFLSRYGFETTSFHGNWGEFYSRRSAFEKMGFKKIHFREDLEPLTVGESDGIGLRDCDVLTYSSLLMRQATGRVCHFTITLTSHSPYTFLKDRENELIPHPSDAVERYLNHIHYVDTCLRSYITSLGKEVTVVIYADHPTESGNDSFTPAREGKTEYVPVFIYDSDRNLATLQQTRDSGLAMDGKLRVVDISSYLRNQVKDNFGDARNPSVDAESATQK